MASTTTHWADIQEQTFTRWVNDYLRQRGLKIKDISTDLSDGIILCNLVEILSKKKVGKWHRHPRVSAQKTENVTMAIEFVIAQKVDLVNIGTMDIVNGNTKIILALIWKLIYFYEIMRGDPNYKNAKNELLEWVRKTIPDYHEKHPIKNFKGRTWCNGLALTALCDALVPKDSKGKRKNFDANLDWTSLDPKDKKNNCIAGIDVAHDYLNIDKLLEGDEMCQKKCDELAIMTYIAQFRNISEELLAPLEDEKEDVPEVSAASQCHAYGPGLIEAISGEGTEFFVEASMVDGDSHKLDVKIEGPSEVEWKQEDNKDGTFTISYTPTACGEYKVSVMVDDEHIPGSVFQVLVLEDESLGGEGKIRVYFSTTSSSTKSKKDRFSLERLLQAKKVHLREDFEPWEAVDLMTTEDRNLVFKKAGTRDLPIVFVDDQYIGDYDKLQELEEEGNLDDYLAMDHCKMVSEEEHLARLKKKGTSDEVKDGDS